MTAFIPVVAANGAITNFKITPDTGMVGDVSAYQVVVNTTGVSGQLELNITIPAGFSVANDTMTSNVEIARVDIYEDTGYYGNATFTANQTNPTTDVCVEAKAGTVTAKKTVKNVDYSPGAVNSINVSVGSTNLNATVTLPAASVGGSNGYLNASIKLPTGHNITNVSISIQQYVQNPADEGDYTFVAKVGTATNSSIVHIIAPAPVPALTPIGLLALVGILSMVLAFATLRRKVQK